MADLSRHIRRPGCPAVARQPRHEGAVRIGPGKNVVFHWTRRPRPLTVYALTLLGDEYVNVAGSACSSDNELATVTPFTLTHGPAPIRDRASVGLLPLSGS